MGKIQNTKQYDLEDRTQEFAKRVRRFLKKVPKSLSNIEDSKQLVKSSGSVGANYIEANESLSKKDFMMRIKICRKEAKESQYWLHLIDTDRNNDIDQEQRTLIQEARELTHIFGSIITKFQ